MLPIALLVAIVAALAWAGSRDAPKPAAGAGAPKQFGTGADKRKMEAGKRYQWTVHIRPPFPNNEALDLFMENFASVQPAETEWEFTGLDTQTIDGQPTEVLSYRATQLVTQTVGLPWRMLERGGFTLTAVDVREVG